MGGQVLASESEEDALRPVMGSSSSFLSSSCSVSVTAPGGPLGKAHELSQTLF